MDNLKRIEDFINEHRPHDAAEYGMLFGDAFIISHDTETNLDAVHIAYEYGFVWGLQYAKSHNI